MQQRTCYTPLRVVRGRHDSGCSGIPIGGGRAVSFCRFIDCARPAGSSAHDTAAGAGLTPSAG